MKKQNMKFSTITILILSLLLQSCYTYKTIDPNKTHLTEGKKYKIKVDNKVQKANLVSLNDSTATFKTGNKNIQIAEKEIGEIKIRKFSILKTASLVTGIALGIIIGIGIALQDFNPGGGNIHGSKTQN